MSALTAVHGSVGDRADRVSALQETQIFLSSGYIE